MPGSVTYKLKPKMWYLFYTDNYIFRLLVELLCGVSNFLRAQQDPMFYEGFE